MTVDEFNDRFKEGDILKIGNWIIIFAGVEFDGRNHPILYYALLMETNPYFFHASRQPRIGIGYVESLYNDHVRFAYNREKKDFYHTLEAKGYVWDEDNKRLMEL